MPLFWQKHAKMPTTVEGFDKEIRKREKEIRAGFKFLDEAGIKEEIRLDDETILYTRRKNDLLGIPNDPDQRTPPTVAKWVFQEFGARVDGQHGGHHEAGSSNNQPRRDLGGQSPIAPYGRQQSPFAQAGNSRQSPVQQQPNTFNQRAAVASPSFYGNSPSPQQRFETLNSLQNIDPAHGRQAPPPRHSNRVPRPRSGHGGRPQRPVPDCGSEREEDNNDFRGEESKVIIGLCL